MNDRIAKGMEQIESAILSFPNMLPENIDLSAFMDDEKTHRVKDAWQYREKLRELILGKGEAGLSMPWGGFHGNFEFRPAEMTIWTGYKGHGKSAVISQVLEHFMDKFGQKVFIISPEFPAHRVLYRLLIQSLKQKTPCSETLDAWLSAVKEQLWLYDQQSSLDPKDIPALCKYAINKLGVKHILIDSLMKCGIAPDDYGAQKRLVDLVQQVAHKSDAHIHLVAHARKGKSDGEIGGLHDVKGASEIADMAENVIIVWRNKEKELGGSDVTAPDAIVKVEAQRNGEGWIGKVPLFYNKHTFSFHDEGSL